MVQGKARVKMGSVIVKEHTSWPSTCELVYMVPRARNRIGNVFYEPSSTPSIGRVLGEHYIAL